MPQQIQLRRGTDAERQTKVLALAEPAFSTDKKRFAVGDGSQSGGVLQPAGQYDIVDGSEALIAGRYLFTGPAVLPLPAATDGDYVTVTLDHGAVVSDGSPAKVTATAITTANGSTPEVVIDKAGVELTFIYRGGWQL